MDFILQLCGWLISEGYVPLFILQNDTTILIRLSLSIMLFKIEEIIMAYVDLCTRYLYSVGK